MKPEEEFLLPFAGERLGLDIREGLSDPGLNELRRALRTDRMITALVPSGLRAQDPMAPEGSGFLYGQLGSIQPPETFGV